MKEDLSRDELNKTGSFLAKQSGNQLDTRQVDLIVESVDVSSAMNPMQNDQEESKENDDFFSKFQKQMEASLFNDLTDF